jgi:hypothetical protein
MCRNRAREVPVAKLKSRESPQKAVNTNREHLLPKKQSILVGGAHQ